MEWSWKRGLCQFVDQPEGFVIKGEEMEVYKLRRAHKAWNKHLQHGMEKSTLISLEKALKKATMKFLHIKKKRGESENNVYVILLFIDDLVFSGSSESLILKFNEQMMKYMQWVSWAYYVIILEFGICENDNITIYI